MSERTIHYLCFYAEEENKDTLISYPSVWSKIDYIIESIKGNGYRLNLISAASIKKNGIYKKRDFIIDDKEKHHYLTSFKTSNKTINKINILYIWIQLIIYIIINVKQNDKILVYHSLFYHKPIKFINRVFKKKFYLEIEDVFSVLNENNMKFEKEELEFFEYADGYLCVNDIIADKLPKNKTKVISYGAYKVQPKYQEKINNNRYINLVYAGVIEQERNAAFIAIETMKYLASEYTLNILGFGSYNDIEEMKKRINDVNKYLGRKAIIYHGRKEGIEYYEFLQSCDIALSTHCYDEINMKSADNTFPSKILVYLSNNLSVVAQRLECLEKSKINKYITFYDRPEAELIANAIKSIDLTNRQDSMCKINEMNNEFISSIKKLLEI